MEENGRLLDTVKDHLEHGRDERLGQLLADAHPADVSNLLRELPVPQQVALFRLLNRERAGAVLSELDDLTLLALVRALPDVETSRILDQMPTEHAAEVVTSYRRSRPRRSWT